MSNFDVDSIYTSHGDKLKGEDLKGCDPVDLTISKVDKAAFQTDDGGKQDKIILSFEQIDQTLILNKTNAKRISLITGTSDASKWPGHTITVHHELVEFGQKMVDAVRVLMPVKKTGKKFAGTKKAAPESENPAPPDLDESIPF